MIPKKIFRIILVMIICPGVNLVATAEELVTPQISAAYFKLSDGTKRITVSLSARENDKRVNIPDAELQIIGQNDAIKTVLGNVITNQQGKASFDIDPATTVPRDQDGYTFSVLFGGNTRLDKASRSIHVTEAFLEISLNEKDTVKTITARMFKRNEKGEKMPVPDVSVEFNVKRLFCLYPIGNEKTDSTGLCTTEFPSNMPGDKTGKVTLVIRTPDNETFGTVEESKDINWGKLLVYQAKPIRGLGDTDAPLWMVYTLIVLLSGVWLHVVYIIILVIRINIIGKKAIKS
jgi:hypothetical protein